MNLSEGASCLRSLFCLLDDSMSVDTVGVSMDDVYIVLNLGVVIIIKSLGV